MRRNFFINIASASPLDLDREAVKRVEAAFNEKLAKDRRAIFLIALGVVAMIAVAWVIGSGFVWLGQAIGASKTVAITMAGIATPLALVGVWLSIFPRIMRRSLRLALRSCGYDICVGCGYLLDGLGADVACPECGAERELVA